MCTTACTWKSENCGELVLFQCDSESELRLSGLCACWALLPYLRHDLSLDLKLAMLTWRQAGESLQGWGYRHTLLCLLFYMGRGHSTAICDLTSVKIWFVHLFYIPMSSESQNYLRGRVLSPSSQFCCCQIQMLRWLGEAARENGMQEVLNTLLLNWVGQFINDCYIVFKYI